MKISKLFLTMCIALIVFAFTGCSNPNSDAGSSDGSPTPFTGVWITNPETGSGVTTIDEYRFGSSIYTRYMTITASTNPSYVPHARTKVMEGTYSYNERTQKISITNTYTGYPGFPAQTFTWGYSFNSDGTVTIVSSVYNKQ